MDVDVRELRYFVAVAEESSFTRAATDRLFISQPALSKQIRALERSLRTTLFERGSRSIRLTPAGEALLPRARDLIAKWGEAQQAVADAAAAHDTTLRVGFQTRIGRGLIPAVTEQMEHRIPGWTLAFRQVSWADPTAGLASGDVDVAIAWLPVPSSLPLTWQVVATEQRWVALPPGHPLTRRRVVPFALLRDEPVIALPPTAGPQREFWLANDQRTSPARIALEVETAEETFEAVAGGRGIVLLSAGNAAIYAREDVVCRPVSGLPDSELGVVWRTDDHRPAVRVFTEALCRCGRDTIA
jgi:DNA-binding transcriptional LysR family regulator